METTITITTINHPTKFLTGLCENIRGYNHKPDILIIGDQKTPDLNDLCGSLSKKYGLPIEYLDIDKQNKIIPKPLLKMFDYNTPDRTILGGMLSYIRGAQRIIALDDDNFVTDADFIGWHDDVGKTKNRQLIQSDTGWFNVHDVLESDVEFYPRGFPFWQRHNKVKVSIAAARIRAVVNQGLVLGDPDIDAIQRLAHPINATRMRNTYEPQFGLRNTWSPFNYQNTCLARELIPCYFRPKSGLRNADIWTAYIFNKLAGHMGDVITFGQPLVKQIRNEHNLFDDLDVELQNNKETDRFCEVLRSITLTETSYFGALNELISKAKFDDKSPMAKRFITEYTEWCKAVSEYV